MLHEAHDAKLSRQEKLTEAKRAALIEKATRKTSDVRPSAHKINTKAAGKGPGKKPIHSCVPATAA